MNIANSRNGRSLDERDRRGRSVVWAEPTLECPSESSIERPKMAALSRTATGSGRPASALWTGVATTAASKVLRPFILSRRIYRGELTYPEARGRSSMPGFVQRGYERVVIIRVLSAARGSLCKDIATRHQTERVSASRQESTEVDIGA